jgi:hypothetical protein
MSGNQHVLGKLANEAVIHVYLSRKNLSKIQKQEQQGQPSDIVTRTELDQLKKDLFLRKDLGNLKKRIVREIDKCAAPNAIIRGDDISDSTSTTSTPVVEELLRTRRSTHKKVAETRAEVEEHINSESESDDEPVKEIPTDDVSDEDHIVQDDTELPDIHTPVEVTQSEPQEIQKPTEYETVVVEQQETPVEQLVVSADKPVQSSVQIADVVESLLVEQEPSSSAPETPTKIDAAPIEQTTEPVVQVPQTAIPVSATPIIKPTDIVEAEKSHMTPIYDPDTESISPVNYTDSTVTILTPASAGIHKLLDAITKKSQTWDVLPTITADELIAHNLSELNVLRKYREMVNAHNDVMMTTFVKQIDKKIDDIKKTRDEKHRKRTDTIDATKPVQPVQQPLVQPVQSVTTVVPEPVPIAETVKSKKSDVAPKSDKHEPKRPKRNSLLMLFKKHK